MDFEEHMLPSGDQPIIDFPAETGAMKAIGSNGGALMVSVLASSPDCIKIVEMNGTLSFMNENGRCAMEVDDFDLIAGRQWSTLWPAETARLIETGLDDARRGKSTRFEAFCPTAKGTPKWWEVTISPVLDPDSRQRRILSISRDITDRVEREKLLEAREAEMRLLAREQARTLQEKEDLLRDKDLLMREIDHRVKNSLAMVSTLLRLQGSTAGEEAVSEQLNKAAERVMTIASVHDRLYRGNRVGHLEFGDYLESLCEDLSQSLKRDDVDFSVVTDTAEVSADIASALGLCVSEFVGNAMRHAFPDGKGTVEVRFSAGSEGSPRSISVTDDGCGLPAGFNAKGNGGLGMKIVRAQLMKLDGELAIERLGKGTRFTITF